MTELTFDWADGDPLQDSFSTMQTAQAFLDPAYTPSRDLRNRRNARSITGQINSIHTKVSHVFESLGEMRHAIICDADWNVVRLETQPRRLLLSDGRTYTPDAKVWLRDQARPIFRELKPVKWLKEDPDLDGKLQLISDCCAQQGCDFELVSDIWYNRQPRLMNSNWIRRAAKHAPDAHLQIVANLLFNRGQLPADEVGRQSGLGQDGVLAAYALVGLRICRTDLDQYISADTLFTMVNS